MPLTLIMGPIKSGKSLELIARAAPYEFANKKVLYVQPIQNVREDDISSRLGVNVRSAKVSSLKEVDNGSDVIGVDEIHMLPLSDIRIIHKWIMSGKEVIVSGLDLDYRGKLMPVVAKILELKPDAIIIKKSVCEICHEYEAAYTQILDEGKIVKHGLPYVVPEDGTYSYQARCRNCFIGLLKT